MNCPTNDWVDLIALVITLAFFGWLAYLCTKD